MATRLQSGQIQLRPVTGVPMERVVDRQVDYMTAARQEAAGSNALAQVLDRMANTVNVVAVQMRQQEALRDVANRPLTPADFAMAQNGDLSNIIPAGNFSVYDQAVRKARSFELSSHFEIEGREKIVSLLAKVEKEQVDPQQIQAEIASMTEGYAQSLAKIDGEAALKFRANMVVHGKTVIDAAREKALKADKERRLIKVDGDLVTQSQLFEANVFGSPELAPYYKELFRKTVTDEAAALGDAAKAEAVSKRVEKSIEDGLFGAVAKYVSSPDFASDPTKAIARLDKNDAGKMTSVWANMPFDQQAKVRSALRDIVSQRVEAKQRDDKELHETRVVEAAKLTSRYLNSGGRDKLALKDLQALSIIDPKAITPEAVFDMPKKLQQGEQGNPQAEFVLKKEIMKGLHNSPESIEKRAVQLGIGYKRLSENVLPFYISRNNEEQRDIDRSFQLESKIVTGQTNLTAKQTDALIGMQTRFDKLLKEETDKANAEGKSPPSRSQIRDRVLKERRESVPAKAIESRLKDLNTSYGAGGNIRKTGITFTEETRYEDIARDKDRLGLRSEDLDAIRQSLDAIEAQRRRLNAL